MEDWAFLPCPLPLAKRSLLLKKSMFRRKNFFKDLPPPLPLPSLNLRSCKGEEKELLKSELRNRDLEVDALEVAATAPKAKVSVCCLNEAVAFLTCSAGRS